MFYYAALKRGEASETLAIMGGFSPAATAAIAFALPPVLLASGLHGLVNVLEKVVYDQTNFVNGYVWFTIGTFEAALALLVRPSWRRQTFTKSRNDEPRNRLWYFVNRFASGVGSFLIFFAISMTHPAVADTIARVRYAVIFLDALLLTTIPGVMERTSADRNF